jgi:hypothetical protein
MERRLIMSRRIEQVRRRLRPVAGALVRPRELFGDSLPELALVVAVFASVVSAAVALSAS